MFYVKGTRDRREGGERERETEGGRERHRTQQRVQAGLLVQRLPTRLCLAGQLCRMRVHSGEFARREPQHRSRRSAAVSPPALQDSQMCSLEVGRPARDSMTMQYVD